MAPSKALLASFGVERVAGGERGRLVLVTHGSGSCPWRPIDVQATGKYAVTITVSARFLTSDRPCDLDNSRRRETLDLPADVRVDEVKKVHLTAANGVSHTAAVTTLG